MVSSPLQNSLFDLFAYYGPSPAQTALAIECEMGAAVHKGLADAERQRLLNRARTGRARPVNAVRTQHLGLDYHVCLFSLLKTILNNVHI